MPRHCPTCGRVFSDVANVCDQHGVTLLNTPVFKARRSRRLWPYAFGVAGVLLAGILATPLMLRSYLSRNVAWEIASMELRNGPQAATSASSSSANLSTWLRDKSLVVTVRVENRSAFSFDVLSADYKIAVSSVPMAEGTWRPPQGTYAVFASGGSHDFPVNIPLEDAVLRSVLLHVPANGLDVTSTGNAVVRLFGRSWNVPLASEMRVRPALPF